jgi:hypothetical protein
MLHASGDELRVLLNERAQVMAEARDELSPRAERELDAARTELIPRRQGAETAATQPAPKLLQPGVAPARTGHPSEAWNAARAGVSLPGGYSLASYGGSATDPEVFP